MAGPRLTSGDRVIVIGTSGFAVELAALLRSAAVQVVGFVGLGVDISLPAPYLGDDECLARLESSLPALVAIGKPALRGSLCRALRDQGRPLGCFVHPAAWVADDCVLGPGSIVYPNATLHSRVTLGCGVVVNSNASVGHECRLADFVTIGPGVALGGRLDVGAGVYFGIGASSLENLEIAAGTLVGAGAVLTRSVSSAGTYVGVPARRLP